MKKEDVVFKVRTLVAIFESWYLGKDKRGEVSVRSMSVSLSNPDNEPKSDSMHKNNENNQN